MVSLVLKQLKQDAKVSILTLCCARLALYCARLALCCARLALCCARLTLCCARLACVQLWCATMECAAL